MLLKLIHISDLWQWNSLNSYIRNHFYVTKKKKNCINHLESCGKMGICSKGHYRKRTGVNAGLHLAASVSWSWYCAYWLTGTYIYTTITTVNVSSNFEKGLLDVQWRSRGTWCNWYGIWSDQKHVGKPMSYSKWQMYNNTGSLLKKQNKKTHTSECQ